jgi:hypothetical protein
VKFVITPRARRQVERAHQWWEQNRDKSPGLFIRELEQAEHHLTALPESGELWRVRQKKTIRRWLLPKTGQHLYYVYNPTREEVLVLALWGARRGRTPKL